MNKNKFTWVSRLLVGLLFIFSGLIKANDPVAFQRKMDEYFRVFHLPFMMEFSLGLAVLLCVLEITLGAGVLIGYRMKLTSWILLLLIIYFTFLTGYSWRTGAVADCGCFGTVIPMTPLKSFIKDLILLVLCVQIFMQRKKIQPLIPFEKLENLLIVFTIAVSGFITVYAYHNNPIMEFGIYKTGNKLPEIFPVIGLNDNVREGNYLLVMIIDVNKNLPNWDKVTELPKANLPMKITGLSGSTSDDTETFLQKHNISFPMARLDMTRIETIARSNLSLMLLQNGVITKKWHENNIPDASEISALLK